MANRLMVLLRAKYLESETVTLGEGSKQALFQKYSLKVDEYVPQLGGVIPLEENQSKKAGLEVWVRADDFAVNGLFAQIKRGEVYNFYGELAARSGSGNNPPRLKFSVTDIREQTMPEVVVE